jgi:hypothetical protein
VASTQRSAKDADSTKDRPPDDAGEVTAAQAARAAVKQVKDLTAKEPIGVTGLAPTEEGWRVEVEIIEEAHIPSTSDLLALYEVNLDPGGELMSYRRTRRYVRGRVDSGNGAGT